jgi:ATP-binding cassette, subfamily B, bacterial
MSEPSTKTVILRLFAVVRPYVGLIVVCGLAALEAAARMFVRVPELLVFDDLSSALDVETETLLWERLAEREGSTCLLVSHRRPVLRMATRIVVMRDGLVAAQGSLESLLESSEEMRTLWRAEPDAGSAAGVTA